MDATVMEEQLQSSAQLAHHRPRWRRAGQAALGVLVAAGTAYGLTDRREDGERALAGLGGIQHHTMNGRLEPGTTDMQLLSYRV